MPLAGIHSVPLFTESLLSEISQKSDYMLVVSMQSISGLRQTFFQNKEFRISRLVQMPRYGTVPYAPFLEEEIEKIRRYLSSLRLVSLEVPLDIYFFLTGSLLEELREYYDNSNLVRYHFLDINEMASKAGFPLNLNTPFSDQYFAYQFLKKRPPNYYATSSNLRYATLRRWRLAMLAASMLLVFSGCVWSSFNFVDGLNLKQSGIAAEEKAKFYQTRYDVARGRLPKTPVEPIDLKVAVEAAAALKNYNATPVEMMQVLSRGLNQFPEIKLDSFEWKASMEATAAIGDNPQAPGEQATASNPNPAPAENKYRYYQIAMVNAHLEPFDGDFRKAIETINNFTEIIKAGPAVYNASIIKLPLNISSTANLQGNTQIVQSEADFSFSVIVGVGDES
ncbi:MAG: hypothetical protein HW386_2458 [Gammaproteobacteria bacterium]|nr:hypothetical protein [Gammaproteobacteria bacterium]